MASANPMVEFQHAVERASSRNIDTVPCALATVSADGLPSLRIVLVKYFDARGFVFHTNYNSRKGRELDANPLTHLPGNTSITQEIERRIYPMVLRRLVDESTPTP